MTTSNQNAEQRARNQIDAKLVDAGWIVQHRTAINFHAGPGIAVREYQTDVGPADYVLFLDKQAVGVIEAKPEEWGHKITTVEDQSAGYATAKLKWVNNKEPLRSSTKAPVLSPDSPTYGDLKLRSREVFTFHRPETMSEWLSKPTSLRARLHDIPLLDPAGLRNCQIKAIHNLEKSFREEAGQGPWFRWRPVRERRSPPSPLFIGCSNTRMRSASFFSWIRKNLGEQAEQEFMALRLPAMTIASLPVTL